MKPHICFIAGTKGGVGKSFAACHLVEAAEDLGLTVAAFDSDTENQTLKNLLKTRVDYLDDTDDDYPLDKVVTTAYQENAPQVMVVDMKAGTSRSSMNWFASVPWNELLQHADICIVCCVTVDPDASRTLSPWLLYFEQLGVPVEYVLIKNEKDGRDFSFYDSTIPDSLKSLTNCLHAEISFPAMDKKYVAILNNAKLTIKEATSTERGKTSLKTVMAQARLKNYYHAFVDPLIGIMAAWIPEAERTDKQKELISSADQRTRLRKTLPEK